MSGIVLALAGRTSGPAPVPVVGSALGGGYFAGQISTAGNGVADYNLVVGPRSSAASTLTYKTTNTGGDPISVIDGPTNSSTMNDAIHPAAQFCEGLTVGGFTDWYMPAINELDVCYYNLKPGTDANSTLWGINPNAVPARASNYTTGDPAQTSATIFQTGNSEAFSTGYNWSSSQYIPFPNYAWTIQFNFGNRNTGNKSSGSPVTQVRAIRRIPV